MKPSKSSMTFSELIYAINNRGKAIKETKALSAVPVVEVEEVLSENKSTFAQDMLKYKKK